MSLLLFFINTGKERKKKKNPALSVFLSIHDLQIIIVIKVILMKSKALSFKKKKIVLLGFRQWNVKVNGRDFGTEDEVAHFW